MQTIALILIFLMFKCFVFSTRGDGEWMSMSCSTPPGGWYPRCTKSEDTDGIVNKMVLEYERQKRMKILEHNVHSISLQSGDSGKIVLVMDISFCPETTTRCNKTTNSTCWFEATQTASKFNLASTYCM